MTDFVPTVNKDEVVIPFWEDASNADGVRGYTTGKSIRELKALITGDFGKIGGSVIDFVDGKNLAGTRYGYQINFTFRGAPGRLVVMALPIRKETPTKINKAKRHALISVHARLESQYNTALVMPGDVPLMPWLLNAEGQTMIEYLQEVGSVPALPEPQEDIIEEGQFVDIEK